MKMQPNFPNNDKGVGITTLCLRKRARNSPLYRKKSNNHTLSSQECLMVCMKSKMSMYKIVRRV